MANERPLKILTDLVAEQSITVSGSSIISGSEYLHTTASFTNTVVSTSSAGMYDVDSAIHSLDTAIGTLGVSVKQAYEGVRAVLTGTLDANGNEKINLTVEAPSGSEYFNTSSLKEVDVSVLLAGEDLKYKNDLLSLQLFNSASCLWVELDAPSANNYNYRLIAVNQSLLPLGNNTNLSASGIRRADILFTFEETTMPVTGTNYNNDPVYWFEDTGELSSYVDQYGARHGTYGAAVPLALPLYPGNDANGGALFVSGAYARFERQVYGLTPIDLGTKFTLSMWIKPTNPNSYYQSILGYTNNNSIYCSVSNNKCKINYYFNGNDHLFNTEFDLNQWNQIVLSYENNTLKAYINGVLDSTTINISPQDMLDIKTLANNGSGAENYTGYISQFKVWLGDAFTAADVSQNGY